MGQYTVTQKCVKNESVRVVTHHDSNESNDSLGVFSAVVTPFTKINFSSCIYDGVSIRMSVQSDV